MVWSLSRRKLLTSAVATIAAPAVLARMATAAEPLLLRCSLETAPSHARNAVIRDYLERTEAASTGRIKTQLFENGQLFPDLQAGKALLQGQIEMAVPGIFSLTGIVQTQISCSCRPSMAAAFMRFGGVANALADFAVAWLGGLPGFLAGILPGLLQAVAFFVWVLYVAHHRKFPVEPARPLSEGLRVTLSALPALLVPLVVMVGIYCGFVTVTEAAALSAVVALGVSLFFYRGFHWRQTLSVVAVGLRSAASIMLIIAIALAVGHWLTAVGAPRASSNLC